MSDALHGTARGWRVAVVDVPAEISVREECVFVQGKEAEWELPLYQFGALIVAEERCRLSAVLLNELSQRGTAVILCDGKREPPARVLPFAATADCAGSIMDQAKWTQKNCDRVWAELVRMKIGCQTALLRKLEIPPPEEMENAPGAVLPGDPDNREGMAARLYFPALFGHGFVRHTDGPVNGALNYGYAILRSCCSRCIAAHGYHPALGIHHRSRSNPTNLSCDIMEPFRPFVDMTVWNRRYAELDWACKQELIGITLLPVRCGGKRMSLQDAVEQITLDVISAVDDPDRTIREIGFE